MILSKIRPCQLIKKSASNQWVKTLKIPRDLKFYNHFSRNQRFILQLEFKHLIMSWTQEQIDAVWKKGRIVKGYDKDKYRLDACGAWMMKSKHGKETSLGWQIDHIFPESVAKDRGYSKEQIDVLDNLRPLQWENNVSKGDDYPDYRCAVTRNGDKNINKERSLTIHQATKETLNRKFRRKSK